MTEIIFLPYVIAWGVLLVVVVTLAIVRGKMASKEDDALKLTDDEVAAVSAQLQVAKRLSTIETIGKGLTILLVVSGLVLAVLYGWSLFTSDDMFAK